MIAFRRAPPLLARRTLSDRRAMHVMVRPKTMGQRELKRLVAAERAAAGEVVDRKPIHDARPRQWSECAHLTGPCPWVGCRHHLYLELNDESGSMRILKPGLEPDEIGETCSLRVAEAGQHRLQEVGDLMNITRERVRQIESRALTRLRRQRWAR